MKNINKYILASTLALGTVFTSCEEEVLVPVEDNEAVAELLAQIASLENELTTYNLEQKTVSIQNTKLQSYYDSLAVNSPYYEYDQWGNIRRTGYDPETRVQYTVNVLSSANYLQGRIAGVAGASVTVRQGEYTETKEVSSGMAVFEGLIPGQATVVVTAPDHTRAELIVGLYDHDFAGDVENYNAATQVVLYPTSGKDMAIIKGSLYANTTTVNDTLNRRYGNDATIFGDKAGTYVAKPGPYTNFSNYTQFEDEVEQGTIYDNAPNREEIQFEAVPAGFSFYAIARPQESLQEFHSGAGNMLSITYTGLVFDATINNDMTYSVQVPTTTKGGLNIEFQMPQTIAPHTRFTSDTDESIAIDQDGDGTIDYYDYYYNVVGGDEEEGSKEQTFKYFNSTNNPVTVYSLAEGGTAVEVAPNKSADIVRRVITENRYYQAQGIVLEEIGSVRPGQVILENIYVWPYGRTN
jgi:hypothetical protein